MEKKLNSEPAAWAKKMLKYLQPARPIAQPSFSQIWTVSVLKFLAECDTSGRSDGLQAGSLVRARSKLRRGMDRWLPARSGGAGDRILAMELRSWRPKSASELALSLAVTHPFPTPPVPIPAIPFCDASINITVNHHDDHFSRTLFLF